MTDKHSILPEEQLARRSGEWSTEQLRKVAQHFYFEGMSRTEIAAEIKRPRQEVARMLAEAMRLGIVQIRIAPTIQDYDLRELERELVERYACLLDAVVMPGHQALIDPEYQDKEKRIDPAILTEGIRFSLAEAAGRYLSRQLSNRSVVVVSTGRMLKSAVQSIRLPASLPGLRIAPIQGVRSKIHDMFAASTIAADLQRVSGGEYYQLPVPAFVPSDLERAVAGLPIVRTTLDVLQRANTVITTIGVFDEQLINEMEEVEFISSREKEDATAYNIQNGYLGAIGSCPFDSNGDPWPLSNVPMGLDLKDLRTIVVKKKGRVIGISGADSRRINAIRGTLNGSLINTLITDHATAQKLVGR
jgi:deoxyribonucleoside regulator